MVDFRKLRARQQSALQVEPMEIFRRLPKPPGINDLYQSQRDVLATWFDNRAQRDTVIKLHTGGGKTMVGLLIGKSSLNETGRPVLYLVANNQLVDQTVEKATELGIDAVPFRGGQPLSDQFQDGSAIMVGSYWALFNGLSKFGIEGRATQDVGTLILDDAHAAFPVVRDAFTLQVRAVDDRDRYQTLVGLFRQSFQEIDRIGVLEDIVSGKERGVVEVPYWAWLEQLDAVREILSSDTEAFKFSWPLVRNELRTCHALISPYGFSVTPIVPGVHQFPAFTDAPRRIYMSATIADDSEIVRTFDADPAAAGKPFTTNSVAGISERMILMPENMPLGEVPQDVVKGLATRVAEAGLGVVVLVPSDREARDWSDVAEVAVGSDEAASLISRLRDTTTAGPAVFSNRYDGIDLPGKSCRLLILSGLPVGTSDYDQYRANIMFGSASTARMLAQRIEQGAGRGSRGSSDHCVVILTRHDLTSWVGRQANFKFFTTPTRAQLDMGDEISREITDLDELTSTVQMCLNRDVEWTTYHAEKLAELVIEDETDQKRIELADFERRAIRKWRAGEHDKAIGLLRRVEGDTSVDPQVRGWMSQLAARIAYDWQDHQLSDQLQRRAHAENARLLRPKARPAHTRLRLPGEQAEAIVSIVCGYHYRSGLGQDFEHYASWLHRDASSNQFEEALKHLGRYMGFEAERKDVNGGGPDVLWLLPEKQALIIEAKSRKEASPLDKDEHGQLVIAEEWFKTEYPDHEGYRVSVHPNNLATSNAYAGGSYALTMDELAQVVVEVRGLLRPLWQSQANRDELLVLCSRLLDDSSIHHSKLRDRYLQPFVTM